MTHAEIAAILKRNAELIAAVRAARAALAAAYGIEVQQ